MLRELLFGCSHRFSWPLKRSDGTYYQVCVHCGAEYGYDWERMRIGKTADWQTICLALSKRLTLPLTVSNSPRESTNIISVLSCLSDSILRPEDAPLRKPQ
jgi:hypothetical protein